MGMGVRCLLCAGRFIGACSLTGGGLGFCRAELGSRVFAILFAEYRHRWAGRGLNGGGWCCGEKTAEAEAIGWLSLWRSARAI